MTKISKPDVVNFSLLPSARCLLPSTFYYRDGQGTQSKKGIAHHITLDMIEAWG